ncbi:Mce-associated membrane protein [Actinopolyspora biskrensis]|uniref:Mce-associated membrane protein n=1 Tax=Actinopolyspora biskrensis TaxID=1470178 RepID=A0A852Z810_9ACTN|nr:hypothetical protein [Actinopolyspora biskrensis]NYH78597.1 Mce-associated membrane protein [Actinopolyspora biskrensis]
MSVSRSTPRRRQSGSPARKPRVAGTRNRTNTVAEDASPREDGTTIEESVRQDTSATGGEEPGGTVPETGAVDEVGSAATAVENSGEAATAAGPAPEDDAAPEDAPGDDTAEGASTASGISGQDPEPRDGTGESRDESAEGQDSGTAEQRETADSPTDELPGSRKGRARRGAGARIRSGFAPGDKPVALTAVLLVLALGFGGLAYWFHAAAHALRHEGPSANAALVDEATTSEVKGQVGSAVEKLFSYDYSNVGKTDKAAENLLVGKAVDQYDKMFETVREQAPEQKMVLTSTVTRSGVTLLEGDRAEVLLFVNQDATSTKSDDGGVYPAQLTVQAEKRDGEWKISNMSQFVR